MTCNDPSGLLVTYGKAAPPGGAENRVHSACLSFSPDIKIEDERTSQG